MEEKLKGKLYKEVLIVIGLLLTIEILLGIFFTEKFGFVMSKMLYFIGDSFGWWINLLAVFSVILGMVLIILNGAMSRLAGLMLNRTLRLGSGTPFPSAAALAAACFIGPWANRSIISCSRQLLSTPCREAGTRRFLQSVRPCSIGPLSSTSFIPFRPVPLLSCASIIKSPFPWGPCWNVRWAANIVT